MGEYIAIGVGALLNLLALAYFLGGMKEKVHEHGRRLNRIEATIWPQHIKGSND